ncbi:hypothetical protein [Mycoplasmopsis columbinasalis]|uniref:Uncharacterized protein n=1 Tax=Mycoplasmopsis columbinasalis TaxID=114880 RepID=A0A449BAW7_9BACT|nr:hypothetical protein [Mycoplasmopsis columbinasalis]VEU78356.1 Uncharacterised protein [Mycoplasmopsis columbinasalis]
MQQAAFAWNASPSYSDGRGENYGIMWKLDQELTKVNEEIKRQVDSATKWTSAQLDLNTLPNRGELKRLVDRATALRYAYAFVFKLFVLENYLDAKLWNEFSADGTPISASANMWHSYLATLAYMVGDPTTINNPTTIIALDDAVFSGYGLNSSQDGSHTTSDWSAAWFNGIDPASWAKKPYALFDKLAALNDAQAYQIEANTFKRIFFTMRLDGSLRPTTPVEANIHTSTTNTNAANVPYFGYLPFPATSYFASTRDAYTGNVYKLISTFNPFALSNWTIKVQGVSNDIVFNNDEKLVSFLNYLKVNFLARNKAFGQLLDLPADYFDQLLAELNAYRDVTRNPYSTLTGNLAKSNYLVTKTIVDFQMLMATQRDIQTQLDRLLAGFVQAYQKLIAPPANYNVPGVANSVTVTDRDNINQNYFDLQSFLLNSLYGINLGNTIAADRSSAIAEAGFAYGDNAPKSFYSYNFGSNLATYKDLLLRKDDAKSAFNDYASRYNFSRADQWALQNILLKMNYSKYFSGQGLQDGLPGANAQYARVHKDFSWTNVHAGNFNAQGELLQDDAFYENSSHKTYDNVTPQGAFNFSAFKQFTTFGSFANFASVLDKAADTSSAKKWLHKDTTSVANLGELYSKELNLGQANVSNLSGYWILGDVAKVIQTSSENNFNRTNQLDVTDYINTYLNEALQDLKRWAYNRLLNTQVSFTNYLINYLGVKATDASLANMGVADQERFGTLKSAIDYLYANSKHPSANPTDNKEAFDDFNFGIKNLFDDLYQWMWTYDQANNTQKLSNLAKIFGFTQSDVANISAKLEEVQTFLASTKNVNFTLRNAQNLLTKFLELNNELNQFQYEIVRKVNKQVLPFEGVASASTTLSDLFNVNTPQISELNWMLNAQKMAQSLPIPSLTMNGVGTNTLPVDQWTDEIVSKLPVNPWFNYLVANWSTFKGYRTSDLEHNEFLTDKFPIAIDHTTGKLKPNLFKITSSGTNKAGDLERLDVLAPLFYTYVANGTNEHLSDPAAQAAQAAFSATTRNGLSAARFNYSFVWDWMALAYQDDLSQAFLSPDNSQANPNVLAALQKLAQIKNIRLWSQDAPTLNEVMSLFAQGLSLTATTNQRFNQNLDQNSPIYYWPAYQLAISNLGLNWSLPNAQSAAELVAGLNNATLVTALNNETNAMLLQALKLSPLYFDLKENNDLSAALLGKAEAASVFADFKAGKYLSGANGRTSKIGAYLNTIFSALHTDDVNSWKVNRESFSSLRTADSFSGNNPYYGNQVTTEGVQNPQT